MTQPLSPWARGMIAVMAFIVGIGVEHFFWLFPLPALVSLLLGLVNAAAWLSITGKWRTEE